MAATSFVDRGRRRLYARRELRDDRGESRSPSQSCSTADSRSVEFEDPLRREQRPALAASS